MTEESIPMRALLLLFPLLAVGCKGKSVALGAGAEPDARLVADVYTWACEQLDTGTGEIRTWEGVFSYNVALEYAPDALVDRSLPASGCTETANIFATDAGSGGTDIPAAPSPQWSNGDYGGVVQWQGPGFYYTSVFANQRSCQEAEDLLGSGTLLSDAGSLSGAITPAPGQGIDGELSGEIDKTTGIAFGAEVTATWDPTGWGESWVQVRREKSGVAVETVTCATTGQSTFTVDDSVWSLMNPALEVDVTNLYVAVQNRDTQTMDDGQQVEVLTRSMHVAVVQD